ncbi:MAG: phage holin [Anaerovoracaceae bacterium]
MNLKLRLKNKVTLLALILSVITFVYQICGIIGIVPPVGEDALVQAGGLVVNILVALGVVVDPTTKGIKDSNQVLSYVEPENLALEGTYTADRRDPEDVI